MAVRGRAKKLGMALLVLGAVVTGAHPFQHCVSDAASLFTGCDVCQSLASASANAQVTVDPAPVVVRCRPQAAAPAAAEAELPRSDSRGPPPSL